jgi:two-component system, LytTR family, sensor kinase
MADPTDSRLKSCALAFGLWTLIALASTLSAGLAEISAGSPPTWVRMAAWNVVNFWLWMLLVPIIGWLGRRTATHGWTRFCLVHGASSLAIAAAQVPARIAIFWVLCGPRQPSVHTLGQYMRGELVDNFHFAILTYWVVLAVLRGMESRRHLRDERLCNAQLEVQLAQSQLRALRTQLKPHFLFNTLNAISALVLAQPELARRVIARLSELLRLTLEDDQSQLLPLLRELEFVRHYLEIQQMRFRDRLATNFDIADETLPAEVPSMILQPIVENALDHGLLAKVSPGTLNILARREGGHLQLIVEDDGLGLPPAGVVEGVGLANTRARLERLFGASASLRVQARDGGGTRVELRLPFQATAMRYAS